MNFDKREIGTILAALRVWQRTFSTRHLAEYDIATNGGTLKPLAASEVDALCERINCGPADTEFPTGELFFDKSKHGIPGDHFVRAVLGPETGIDNAILIHSEAEGEPWEDARRFVACWHACATIPTEMLEAVGQIITQGALPHRILTQKYEHAHGLLTSVRDELAEMGFADPDQSVDGGDCCEYLGKLFVDIDEALERDADEQISQWRECNEPPQGFPSCEVIGDVRAPMYVLRCGKWYTMLLPALPKETR